MFCSEHSRWWMALIVTGVAVNVVITVVVILRTVAACW